MDEPEACTNTHPVLGPCHGEKGHQGKHWSNGFGNWIRAIEWYDSDGIERDQTRPQEDA